MSDFCQTVSCARLPQQDGSKDGAVALHLFHQALERDAEFLLEGSVLHAAHGESNVAGWPGQRGDVA